MRGAHAGEKEFRLSFCFLAHCNKQRFLEVIVYKL